MASMSPNPAVVTSPTTAPVRASSAFVATVVPCTNRLTSSGRASSWPRASSSPVTTAWSGAAGDDDTFHTSMVPSGLRTATSVNVPPVSTATP